MDDDRDECYSWAIRALCISGNSKEARQQIEFMIMAYCLAHISDKESPKFAELKKLVEREYRHVEKLAVSIEATNQILDLVVRHDLVLPSLGVDQNGRIKGIVKARNDSVRALRETITPLKRAISDSPLFPRKGGRGLNIFRTLMGAPKWRLAWECYWTLLKRFRPNENISKTMLMDVLEPVYLIAEDERLGSGLESFPEAEGAGLEQYAAEVIRHSREWEKISGPSK